MNRSLSFERQAARMNAILWMLQCNTVVCTIDLPGGLNSDEIENISKFHPPTATVEMNRTCFKVQRQAVKIFPFVPSYLDVHCTWSKTT
jgi:hypothetical protein